MVYTYSERTTRRSRSSINEIITRDRDDERWGEKRHPRNLDGTHSIASGRVGLFSATQKYFWFWVKIILSNKMSWLALVCFWVRTVFRNQWASVPQCVTLYVLLKNSSLVLLVVVFVSHTRWWNAKYIVISNVHSTLSSVEGMDASLYVIARKDNYVLFFFLVYYVFESFETVSFIWQNFGSCIFGN